MEKKERIHEKTLSCAIDKNLKKRYRVIRMRRLRLIALGRKQVLFLENKSHFFDEFRYSMKESLRLSLRKGDSCEGKQYLSGN